MIEDRLVPGSGCLVKKAGDDLRGRVRRHMTDGAGIVQVQVEWPNKATSWVPVEALESGFRIGTEVEECRGAGFNSSLGRGEVIDQRTLGGRTQLLVDFLEAGRQLWMPFQNLKAVVGVRQRLEQGKVGPAGDAERFRLKALAYALELWHQNTGALSHLDIDPLPHQIHLVHHILKSGNLNWLIADDVGLGKTVELGMLVSALKARGGFRRILLICPAGLVRQWKEEMHHKFGLSEFQIYGEDFFINDGRDWKLHDHVIGSMDLLKGENHRNGLMTAEPWDLVVFDEAHRLARTTYGLKTESSDRYRLAASLRTRTPAMILLSATPHQGKQDKFQALLELIRPEWKEQINSLAVNLHLLPRMVLRNHKADVTDSEGNFIFKGKRIVSIPVEQSEQESEFDLALQSYLKKGYAAAGSRSGKEGRAIGFVMTAYRKLAASSIAAIEAALVRRRGRLHGEIQIDQELSAPREDDPFEGEWEESLATRREEFFAGEIALVDSLVAKARGILHHDLKTRSFVDRLVDHVLATNPTERVLVFTEYRGTQDYIAEAIGKRFGKDTVFMIHGGMNHQERESSIASFENTGQFLISTEAGGEGINLQRKCHVMVNFDLPWNPMRLVQRVGRLYRYGQTNQVVVFNLHAPQSLDGEILSILYQRVQQVVADMAPLGAEYRPGLEDEIMGRLADLVDVDQILANAITSDITRTKERLDEALERAREAADLQSELFTRFASFDSKETQGELRLSSEHLKSFVKGMCTALGISIAQRRDRDVLDLQVPAPIQQQLGVAQ